MNDQSPPPRPPTMPVGGSVMAIVPQTFEELQRIANTIIAGRLAPSNLVKVPKDTENAQTVQAQNVAAVSSVLMAGAELGLPPMVALRSFTVINGRPALYADGNVAVIRKARDLDGSRICKKLNRGFILVLDADNQMSDQSFGWCESERADTGEVYREEFSIEDAKTAGLWDPAPMVVRETWGDARGERVKKELPNDSTWHCYWKKMLMWRATGFCLRWLFADILGGLVDEYEARDTPMRDITPTSYAQPEPRATTTNGPPEPPPEEGKTIEGEAVGAPPAAEEPPVADSVENPDEPASAQPEPPAGTEPPLTPEEVTKFLEDLEGELAFATNEQTVEEIFDLADVQVALSGNDFAIATAFKVKEVALHRVARAETQQSAKLPDAPAAPPARGAEEALGYNAPPDSPPEPPPADEQGDIFPPEPPSVK